MVEKAGYEEEFLLFEDRHCYVSLPLGMIDTTSLG